MKHEKSRFKLCDLADAWGCSIDDILELGESGDLTIYVWADFWNTEGLGGNTGVHCGPAPMAPYQVARLRFPTGRPALEDHVAVYTDGEGEIYVEAVKVTNTQTTIESLFVTKVERERFEQGRPHSAGRVEQTNHTKDKKAQAQADFDRLWWKYLAEGRKTRGLKKTICYELSKRTDAVYSSDWDEGSIARNVRPPKKKKGS